MINQSLDLIYRSFAPNLMMKKIAIPTREGMVDDHFGHCAYYTVVTLDEQNQIVNQERLDSPEGCGCKSNIASVMQEMGITLMLAGNMGMGAAKKIMQHNIMKHGFTYCGISS